MSPGWRLLTIGVVSIMTVWGCATEDPPVPAWEEAESWEPAVPEADTDPVRPDSIEGEGFEISQPPGLGAVAADPVQGWTGPGGRHFEVALRTSDLAAHLSQRIGRRIFPLAARVGDPSLSQYPCSSCHGGEVVSGSRASDAHANIRATHPEAAGSNCAFCHVADSVELLNLREGGTASLDHAYRLCAQCHVDQTRDWAAGVHGKRLEGWYGRRVVMNCADCHDPHRPGLELRIPYPGPALTRGGSP